MRPFWRLSAAGFAATALTYGPARMGFGLFLPEFREVFSVSTQAAGLISSLGFFGFFSGLIVSQFMTNRGGPRLPIIWGLILATVGMGITSMAPNLAVLSGGVLLSMSSVGFSWSPFNNAIHRDVEDRNRPTALSLVSTGTSIGIAAAGSAALLASLGDLSWRVCWAVFAAGSALALLGNWLALWDVAGTPGEPATEPWTALLRPSAVPLYGIGLCFGITSAIYITFAADRIAGAGGVAGLPASASGGLVFICYGLFGLLGLVAGKARDVAGLGRLVRILLLASALSYVLLALAPTSWPSVAASAGLQGINVMIMSAVMAFWSDRLFPTLPSQAFTAVLLTVAAGSVLGPGAAGFASQTFGLSPMFLGTAALAAVAAAAFPAGRVRERNGGG